MSDEGGHTLRVIVSAVMAMTLVGALVGGVMLITRARDAIRSPEVEFAIGPGPGEVTLRPIDDPGDRPFMGSIAIDLDIDPVRLVLPPRTGIAAESASRRGSTADLLVANVLAPRLVEIRDGGIELGVAAVRQAVELTVGTQATVADLLDADGDGIDDDRRFSVEALDGSAVCVTVGDRRALATALALSIDPIDEQPSSGVAWTTHGPCDTAGGPPLGTEVRVGTTPGTYGGVGRVEVCDAALLVDRLGARPLVARSWAAAHGIDVGLIDEYVASLIPAILLRDTLVTEYEFDSGRIHPRQVVLQRGTSVMVDRIGQPRVRCLSGAPLRRPQATMTDSVLVLGEPWRGFSIDAVVDLPAAETAATRLVLVDIRSGGPIVRELEDDPASTDRGFVGAFDGP